MIKYYGNTRFYPIEKQLINNQIARDEFSAINSIGSSTQTIVEKKKINGLSLIRWKRK